MSRDSGFLECSLPCPKMQTPHNNSFLAVSCKRCNANLSCWEAEVIASRTLLRKTPKTRHTNPASSNPFPLQRRLDGCTSVGDLAHSTRGGEVRLRKMVSPQLKSTHKKVSLNHTGWIVKGSGVDNVFWQWGPQLSSVQILTEDCYVAEAGVSVLHLNSPGRSTPLAYALTSSCWAWTFGT